MAIGSGLGRSFGYAPESTFGVPVAPTLHIPLVEESLSCEVSRVDSKSIIKGARTMRSSQWSRGTTTAGGDTGFELYDRAIQPLLLACFGTVSGGGPFTYVPGDLVDNFGTVQINRPSSDGVDRPFTYTGAMVSEFEFACKVDENASMGITWACRDEILHRTVTDGATTNTDATVESATAAFGPSDLFKPISGAGIPANSYVGRINSATSIELSSSHLSFVPVNATATASGVTLSIGTALTSASYPSGLNPMSCLGGNVEIANSLVAVKEISFKGNNGLKTDRKFIGTPYPKQAIETALRQYTGTMKLEFENTTQYRRYLNGDEFAIEIDLEEGDASLDFTLHARYDGKTPTMSGTDIGEQELPFTCLGIDTDAEAVTAVFTPAA